MRKSIMKYVLFAIVLLVGMCASAGKPPVKIIFDTDMYTDYDDTGALAVLHTLANLGEAEILATISCTRDCLSVAATEIINKYYDRGDLPVACTARTGGVTGISRAHERVYGKLLKDYEGWYRYKNSSSAPDALKLYRQILSKADDNSVVICSVGFLTNIADLLESKADEFSPLNGVVLVAKKVKLWVVMACKYPKGKEYNAQKDGVSSRRALELCPVPILFSDFDYGVRVFSGRGFSEKTFSRNPVHDVYKRVLPSLELVRSGKAQHNKGKNENGHCSWDQVTVLAAVRGTDKYFNLEKGTYKMRDDSGMNEWIADPNSRNARLVEKMPYDEVGRVIDELMSRY